MTIRKKLLLATIASVFLLASAFLAVAVRDIRASGEAETESFRKNAMEQQVALVRQQVQTALSLLKPYADSAGSAEAKARAREILGRIRFGSSSGYIFVYDYDGICQVFSARKAWVGTPRIAESDRYGRAYIRDLVGAARKGGDTVRYSFEKPGTSKIADKISWAEGFEPWKWMVGSGVYIDDIDSMVAVKQAEIRERTGRMALEMLAVLLAVFVVVAPATVWLLARTFKPVESLRERMQELAGGEADLRKRLEIVSRDEVGDVSESFNRFLESIRGAVVQVAAASREVNRSSADLESMSGEMSRESGRIANQSSAVTESVTKAARGMQAVSGSAQSANRSVSTLAAAIEEMNASLSEVARHGQQELKFAITASERALAAREAMARLDQVVEGVGGILEAVEGIAEQTKLLALNATIEAARAGEAGKGFAVVAGEVKGLALQTAKATAEIRGQIEQIRSGGKEAAAAFTEVERVIEEVHQLSQVVGSAVEQQSATVAEIARTVGAVDREVGLIAGAVRESAGDLASSSEELAEVEKGSRGLREGVEHLDSVAHELGRSAAALDAAMGRFKAE